MPPKLLALGFAAGFLAVLVFHQAVIAAMWAGGIVPFAPYSLAPRPPLGVPTFLSLAFWGGVWGVVIAAVARARPSWPPVLIGLVVGGVGCVLFGFTVVAALRGQPLMGGWDAGRWIRSIVINGAWGLGAGWLYAIFARRAAAA